MPIFDAAGKVAGIYGRRVSEDEPKHLYLPGPHRGVWNAAAARTNQTLFITEAILDGMSLWQAGYRNVIAMYGTNGWTPDHEQLLKEQRHDRDFSLPGQRQGGRGSDRPAEKRSPADRWSKQVHVVRWPEGVKDANDFFLSRLPTDFEKQCLEPLTPQRSPPQSIKRPKARESK